MNKIKLLITIKGFIEDGFDYYILKSRYTYSKVVLFSRGPFEKFEYEIYPDQR